METIFAHFLSSPCPLCSQRLHRSSRVFALLQKAQEEAARQAVKYRALVAEAKTETAKQLAEQAAKHAAEIRDVEGRYETEYLDAVSKRELEVREAQEQLNRALILHVEEVGALARQHEAMVAGLRAELEKAKSRYRTSKAAALQALQTELEEAKKQHEAMVAGLRAELEKVKSRHRTSKAAETQALQAELEEAKTKHTQELDALTARFEKDRSAVASKCRAELEAAEFVQNAELKAAESKHKAASSALFSMHEADLKERRIRDEIEINKVHFYPYLLQLFVSFLIWSNIFGISPSARNVDLLIAFCFLS